MRDRYEPASDFLKAIRRSGGPYIVSWADMISLVGRGICSQRAKRITYFHHDLRLRRRSIEGAVEMIDCSLARSIGARHIL